MNFLTGIQPSGDLHIGNYFGAIKQMVALQDLASQKGGKVFAFLANYHAMTSLNDGNKLKALTTQAALDFLALGIDPDKSIFWVQSDVKEVLELYWILSQITPVGLLERGHSYKDKIQKGIAPNHGLLSYPVLMAADILLFGSNIVPVGKDQIQHVEIARDIAIKFNNLYGEILVVPEFKINEEVDVVPGTDGAKMSKSYKNTIEIFSTQKALQTSCKKIITDSTPLEAPKEYATCNIYKLASLFLPSSELTALQERYKSGKEGYGHFKLYLADVIWEYFAPYRKLRETLAKDPMLLQEILQKGAQKARQEAMPIYEKIKRAVGV